MSTIDFPPPAKHLHFTHGGNLAVRSLPGPHPGAAHISGWLYHDGVQVPVAEICASQIHLPWIPADEPEAPTRTEATDPAARAIIAEAVITAWVDAQASPHYRAAERCYRAYDQRTALRAHQGLQDDPATEATLRHLTALIMPRLRVHRPPAHPRRCPPRPRPRPRRSSRVHPSRLPHPARPARPRQATLGAVSLSPPLPQPTPTLARRSASTDDLQHPESTRNPNLPPRRAPGPHRLRREAVTETSSSSAGRAMKRCLAACRVTPNASPTCAHARVLRPGWPPPAHRTGRPAATAGPAPRTTASTAARHQGRRRAGAPRYSSLVPCRPTCAAGAVGQSPATQVVQRKQAFSPAPPGTPGATWRD